MIDICYLANKKSYTDKEGQVHYIFEVVAGEVDNATGFVNGAKTYRIVQDTDTVPNITRFGTQVQCSVAVSSYFDVETKSERTLVKYSSIEPYKKGGA